MIMKRFLFVSLILLASSAFCFGTDWVKIQSEKPADANKILVESNIETSTIQFTIPGFLKNPVKTPNGQEYVINLGNATQILDAGAPDLPKLTASVVVPDLAGMDVKVISSEYIDIENISIAPSKGNLTRDVDPSTVAYTYGEVYQEDGFFPGELATLRDPYIIRDYRGQTVVFYPFQYNPVSKTLRVYYDVTLKIYQFESHGENPLIRKGELMSVNDEFNKIYNHHFLNTGSVKYDPVDEQGSMLIISHGEFMEAMEPFVEWKKTIGMPTEMIDVSTIGLNSAQIKTFIADYYDEHDLTFVLLVGDDAQVPSSYASGDSDNDYSYIVGNDHYPDIFVGRFSSENVGHVETQVQRTLEYEQNPYADFDWFSRGIGIASSQGPGDDNEYDYEHIRVIHEKLHDFTYTYCSELFDGSQGGLDEPGNPNPAMVAEDVNEGASVINYTGHGSTNSWSSSGFSSNNVNQLTNNGMYPFIWSVACVNGNFVNSTCFAEAWLRATDNDQPSGAIATMMSTINQSWDPPMCGQDAMNDILVESYEDNIKRSFGGISMNGCMEMNDEYGSGGTSMTDTWNCFGDPSLMVRTASPQDISATYNSAMFLGTSQLSVASSLEEGMVALTKDYEILSTAYIQGGTATLEFEPFDEVGYITIAITAFNHIPHIAEIEVIPADGPYVVFKEFQIDDVLGNGNGLADYGETVHFTIDLENVGIEDANEVQVVLESDNEYVTIVDPDENYASIPAGQIVGIENGFTIELSADVPDNQNILFNVTATSADDETWTSSFSLVAHAPALAFNSYTIDDADGNGNGRLDPGETVSLNIRIENTGSASAYEITGLLETEYLLLEIETGLQEFGMVEPATFAEQTYTISCPLIVPQGTAATLDFIYFSSEEEIGMDQFDIEIGHPQILILDLENSPLTGTVIRDLLIEQGITPRYITEFPEDITNDYELIFTCLGVYPNNYVLQSTEGSMLAGYLNAGGNLYMEGGDTWSYDDQTAVHTLFNIDGTDDGSGDLGTLQGVEDTYTSGFEFEYGGENSYIDRLQVTGTAFDIFSNVSPDYICAIAYQAENYKTIGASFEFGGLEDGDYTKSELLDKYLEFFEISMPGKPEIPIGEGNVCISTEEGEYYVPCLDGISYYYWNIYPVDAGEIIGTDTLVTIAWNADFTGQAEIQVCGLNGLGMGPMSDPFIINVWATPEVSLGQDTSICFYHSIIITPGDDYASYEWMDGSTTSSIEIDSTFGTMGSNIEVMVIVTDEHGCSNEAMVTVTLDECAGIGEFELNSMIDVYPNPSDGNVTIDVSGADIQLKDIKVLNSIGRMIHQPETLQTNKVMLNLGQYGTGIYFIILDTNLGRLTRKVIIN